MSDKDRQTVCRMLEYCVAIELRRNEHKIDEQLFMTESAYADMILMPLVQIGELAGQLSIEFRADNDSIPWQSIKDFRNLIVHDYDGLNRQWAWNDLQADIPQLALFCKKYLEHGSAKQA